MRIHYLHFWIFTFIVWVITVNTDGGTVSKRLKCGDFKFAAKRGGTSKVWFTFGVIVDTEGSD